VNNPDDALRKGTIDFFPLLTLTPQRRREFNFRKPGGRAIRRWSRSNRTLLK
jgi:hypothetical protein